MCCISEGLVHSVVCVGWCKVRVQYSEEISNWRWRQPCEGVEVRIGDAEVEDPWGGGGGGGGGWMDGWMDQWGQPYEVWQSGLGRGKKAIPNLICCSTGLQDGIG